MRALARDRAAVCAAPPAGSRQRKYGRCSRGGARLRGGPLNFEEDSIDSIKIPVAYLPALNESSKQRVRIVIALFLSSILSGLSTDSLEQLRHSTHIIYRMFIHTFTAFRALENSPADLFCRLAIPTCTNEANGEVVSF